MPENPVTVADWQSRRNRHLQLGTEEKALGAIVKMNSDLWNELTLHHITNVTIVNRRWRRPFTRIDLIAKLVYICNLPSHLGEHK